MSTEVHLIVELIFDRIPDADCITSQSTLKFFFGEFKDILKEWEGSIPEIIKDHKDAYNRGYKINVHVLSLEGMHTLINENFGADHYMGIVKPFQKLWDKA